MSARISLICTALSLLITVSPVSAYWEEGGVPASAVPVHVDAMQSITDGSGGIVVVWQGTNLSNGEDGTYAQSLDAEGNALWIAGGVQVSDYLPSGAVPQIIPNGNGWTVMWVESHDIYAIKLDTDGNLLGIKQLLWSGVWGNPQMIQVNGDEAILAFQENTGNRVHALYINDDLTTVDIGVLNHYTLEARNPHLVPDNTGGAIVIWESYSLVLHHWLVSARRINVSGWVWDPEVTAIDWESDDIQIEVVSDNEGGVVIAADHEGTHVLVQRLDSEGTTYWNDAIIDTMTGARFCPDCTANQSNPSIAVDSEGNAVIAFELEVAPDAEEIYAQRLELGSATWLSWMWNSPTWYPVPVQAPSPGAWSSDPRVVKNTTGGTVVAWRNRDAYDRVYAQSLDQNGWRYWSDDVLLTELDYLSLVCSVDELVAIEEDQGGAYIAWAVQGESQDGVYVNRVTRITDPFIDTVFNPSFHDWDATVFFNVLSGDTKARVYHDPHGCDMVCSYDKVAESETSTSVHSISLDDSTPHNGNDTHLYPTSAYCYRVVPGGLPVYEGTLYLQNGPDLPLYIDAEDATIDQVDCSVFTQNAWSKCFLLTDNAEVYQGVMQYDADHENTVSIPWVDDTDRRIGANCIAFQTDSIDDPTADPPKQRAEVGLIFDTPFQELRYTGFSLKISEESDTPPDTNPNEWVNLAQWWQDNEVNTLMNFGLANDSGTLKIVLRTHDEEYCSWPANNCVITQPGHIPVANEVMPKGEWVDFVVGFQFDPYGNCGYIEMWMNGNSVGSYQGKVGFPEPWSPECGDSSATYDNIRQNVFRHAFGIYRANANKLLEVRFDEVKHGFSYEDVAPPPVKITNESVVASFDPVSHTWNATITFDTDRDAIATVRYDPVSNCYDDCSYSHSEPESGGPTTNHTVVLTGLVAPQYCYRIEASEVAGEPVTYIDGSFELDNGFEAIYDIVHTWNESRCKVNVEWRTKYPSKNNKLYYRRIGATTWRMATPRQSNCDPARFYSAGFPVTTRPEFYISTHVNGVHHVSDIIQRGENCDEPIIIRMMEEEKQEKTVTAPFVHSQPNPFNPSTMISFGVPSPSHVELNVYDAAGRHVSTLVSGTRNTGVHSITWDGTNSKGGKVTSGVYFARLIVGETVLTSKLVLLK